MSRLVIPRDSRDTEAFTATPKRRSVARVLTTPWRAVHRTFLRWTIYETECYLRACERDGLTESLSLDNFRGQLAAMRVRLASLHD